MCVQAAPIFKGTVAQLTVPPDKFSQHNFIKLYIVPYTEIRKIVLCGKKYYLIKCELKCKHIKLGVC